METLESELAAALARIEEIEQRLDDIGVPPADEWIRTSEIWTVGTGGDYATLGEAWSAALDKRIMPNGSLRIQLLDGDHALDPNGLTVNHPDGASISIAGSSSAAVTLEAQIGGLFLNEGHELAAIEGFTLQGQDQPGFGLWLRGLARLGNVTDVVVRDFGVGAIVEEGSSVRTNFMGLTTTSNIEGMRVTHGGLVEGSIVATDNEVGIGVNDGSVVRTNGAVITGNDFFGADVRTWGLLNAPNSDFTGSDTGVRLSQAAVFAGGGSTFAGGSTGISVEEGSFAEIVFGTFDDLIAGVVAKHNSTVMANGINVTNTTTPLTVETDSVVVGYPPPL